MQPGDARHTDCFDIDSLVMNFDSDTRWSRMGTGEKARSMTGFAPRL
jgi:hypothetical protein